jgi:hypothetical protein
VTFDDAFLDEVARLLPDADVVRLRAPAETMDPVPVEVATARWRDELRRVATSLVAGWPQWLPTVPPPEHATVRWTAGERADHVQAEVVGRVRGKHDVDVEAAGAALTAAGWSVAEQEQGGRDVRLIGRRATDRAELVVRPSEQVLLVRIAGAPIAVGALSEALVAAGRRDLPWPAGATRRDTA